jgi:plasmid stability protein
MTVIEIPDEQAAALKAKAAAQGLSLEDWFSKLASQDTPTSHERQRRAQTAAARIRELQKHVKPDPEGWTVRDYINYGRP